MSETRKHPFMGEHPLATTGCYMGCGKDKDDPIHAGYDKLGRPTETSRAVSTIVSSEPSDI